LPEIRQLISAIHDRIELQQLRTAAHAAAGQPRRLGPPGTAALALFEPSLDPTAAQPGTGRDLTALAPRPVAAPGLPAPPPDASFAPLFLSIPLAFGGQLSTLDLLVQREPDNRRASGAEAVPVISASLSLDLRHLGQVGADIRLQGAQLRCRLRASRPETAERVSRGTEQLRQRLESAGLDVRALDCTFAPPEPGAGQPAVLRHVAVEV